jgi:hypothetical protein
MPCNKVKGYVEKAITSLMGQSLMNFEVIAVDDGSRDDALHRLCNGVFRYQCIHDLTSLTKASLER